MTEPEPLACKVPGCDRTRNPSSPEFCTDHEFAARRLADRAVREAELTADLGARFEQWCLDHGHQHPHH